VSKPLRYLGLLVIGVLLLSCSLSAFAAGSSQTQQSDTIDLEGTNNAPAQTQAATIATPTNGQNISSTPTTVAGLCKTGLLIKIFSNNIFIGSAQCVNGSYSLQVSLFSGRNDIVARVYDALDQAGPDSNLVSVTFNDAQFAQFGSRVSLTSSYAKRGANPGTELDWPIVLSGGTGPYALSVDWGDGTSPSLQSESFTGTITVKHIYTSAGIFNVVVKATDANGTTAFLQLVGVANGKVTQANSGSGNTTDSSGGGTNKPTPIWPLLALIPLIVLAFWLGRRHELYSIRKHLDQSRNDIKY